VLALRQQDGEVVEPGLARRGARARQLGQAQQLGAVRPEPRLAGALLEQLQAERPVVEVERAREVGDRQRDGTGMGAVR
jgi:hypothetical protein